MPGRGDLAAGIAGPEQSEELVPAVVVDPLMRLGEQPPAAVEGIVLVAPVSERLVLDPTATFVELVVSQLDHVERIGDLGGVRDHGVEHGTVGAGEIEGGKADGVQPLPTLCFEPGLRVLPLATRDDVEELAASDIDDLGREVLKVIRTFPHEEHLIEPESVDRAEATGQVDECCAVGNDGVVDGVPVAAELDRHLVHTAGAAADLLGNPTTRSGGDRHSRRRDPLVLLGPGTRRAVGIGTAPTALVPDQRHRTSRYGEVNEADRPLVLHMGDDATRRATGPRSAALDVDLENGPTRIETDHLDVGEADEDLAHPDRVALKRPPQPLHPRHRLRLAAASPQARDAIPPGDPKRPIDHQAGFPPPKN